MTGVPNNAAGTKTVQVSLQDGIALHRKGHIEAAATIYQAVVKAHPGNANAWNLLGTASIENGKLSDAKSLLEKAVALDPRSAAAHNNLGVLLRGLGEMADSRSHLETAIELKPDYAEAYHNYAACRRFEAGDDFISAVEGLLDEEMSDEDVCFLHFAAGKYYDDIALPEQAFAHYRSGNRLKGATFDADEEMRRFSDLAEVFDPALFERFQGHGHDSEAPIFVVGMPRSGTSLVEQVLASHPEVFGAGELRDISAIAGTLPRHVEGEASYPSCLRDIDPKVVSGFAGAYIERVRAMAPEGALIVDKHPLNFQLLGLIAIMFPKARIIHCRRAPLDTCLSCYFQNFKNGQDFSFDLDHLGQFYRRYHDAMEHWRAVLPVSLLEVHYEDLVEDQEAETRRLLSHCGLAWDPACADFFNTKRPVRTASSWQVRQPIYRTSLGRWKAYEGQLQPLIEALGPLATP